MIFRFLVRLALGYIATRVLAENVPAPRQARRPTRPAKRTRAARPDTR